MRLELCTWIEVEEYLKSSKAVIIPIGATEQHGPTGYIGTDAICARVLARAAGEIAGAMVAPSINVGMSEHHMKFAGSMTLLPSTLLLVVRDCVISLARHGFERFFFVNGHGGNVPTIKAAFSEIYSEAAGRSDLPADIRCKLVSWWESEAASKTVYGMFGDKEGAHATPGEVSVSYFAYPESVKEGPPMEQAPPHGDYYTSADMRRRYPDGRMGSDPSLASVDKGKEIVETAAAGLAELYQAFIAEK